MAQTSTERIIVETDCPYLAPVPMRGRRNEPAFLPHVLAALAQVRGWLRTKAWSSASPKAADCDGIGDGSSAFMSGTD